jgi:hypothetical protein
MLSYDKVFELIKDGEWDRYDFDKWLDEYEKMTYDDAYQDGYNHGIYAYDGGE